MGKKLRFALQLQNGSIRTMANVDTQNENISTVTQVVYKAVFEGNEMFREISEKQAEKRRAEEAAREEAASAQSAPSPQSKAAPSVILDIQSTAIDSSSTSQSPTTTAAPHTVNLIA